MHPYTSKRLFPQKGQNWDADLFSCQAVFKRASISSKFLTEEKSLTLWLFKSALLRGLIMSKVT